MQIETDRLIMTPLTKNQLESYLRNDFSLEQELGLNLFKRSISKPLEEVIQNIILPQLDSSHIELEYRSIWLMIDKSKKVIVGSFSFKGVPKKSGKVEIGYGTEEQFLNKGYMKEAISGLIKWAIVQESISAIEAETDISNISSQRVLLKNGFTQLKAKKSKIKWVLNV